MKLKHLFYISGLLLIGVSLLFGVDEIRITTNPTADEVRIADQKVEVSTVSAVQFISSGTVGIGTPDPSSALDILNGSITVRGTNAGISIAGQPVSTVAANSFALDTSGSTQTKTGGLVLNGYMGLNGTASSRFDVIDGSITVRGTNAGMRLSGFINFGASPSTATLLHYNGFSVLNFSPIGSGNTFLGEQVQIPTNVNAIDNTGLGFSALNVLSSGDSNTGVGSASLLLNTTGRKNTAIGYLSGETITTGSNNTFLGYDADTTNANLFNSVAIGANSTVNVSSAMVLGGTGTSAVNVGINTNAPSSRFDLVGGSITVRGGNAGLVVATSAFVVNTNAQVGIGTAGTSSLLDIVGGSVTIRGGGKGLIQGSTDFVVTNNGQVGIGTNSPTSAFDVAGGSITIRGTNGGLSVSSTVSLGSGLSNMKLALYDAGGSSLIGFGIQAGQFIQSLNVTSDRFSFLGSYGGTEIMSLSGTGNLGINTTSPSSKLDVVGGSVTVRGNNAGFEMSGGTLTVTANSGTTGAYVSFSTGTTTMFQVRGSTVQVGVSGGFINIPGVTTGTALCINASGRLSVCSSLVGADGTCTCAP